jgi:hypothetical protein
MAMARMLQAFKGSSFASNPLDILKPVLFIEAQDKVLRALIPLSR